MNAVEQATNATNFGPLDKQGSSWLLATAGYITILIMIVGLVGNLVTIIALLKFPRIRHVTAAFIISLGIADGLFCAVVLPFNAWRFFDDGWTKIEILCNLIPFLQYANIGLSLLFIAMITINRYVLIVHNKIYTRMYHPMYVAAMIVFCLVLSFSMQLPTLLGVWGKYERSPELRTCTVTNDERGHSSKRTLFITGFVVPCIVIVCCYTRIFWVVRSSENTMRKHSRSSRHQQCSSIADVSEVPTPVRHERKKKRNEWRITKMVLAIFFSFLICYLPITITKVIDEKVHHLNWHIFSYLMVYMSACVNPIIYVIMNKQYRKAFSHVLTCNAASIFSHTSVQPREQPSRTMISQISISTGPINAVNGHKVESTKL